MNHHMVLLALLGAYSKKNRTRWVEDTSYGHRGYLFAPARADEIDQIAADVAALVGPGQTSDGYSYSTQDAGDYALCLRMLAEKWKLEAYIGLK